MALRRGAQSTMKEAAHLWQPDEEDTKRIVDEWNLMNNANRYRTMEQAQNAATGCVEQTRCAANLVERVKTLCSAGQRRRKASPRPCWRGRRRTCSHAGSRANTNRAKARLTMSFYSQHPRRNISARSASPPKLSWMEIGAGRSCGG